MPAKHLLARGSDNGGNEANVGASTVEISLVESSRSLLRARYRLRAASLSDRRPLRIDFSSCPLWPLSIESSASNYIELDQKFQQADNVVLLTLRDVASAACWDNAEVTIEFRWAEERHAHLVKETVLYAPEELPIIGRQNALASTSSQRTSVTLSTSARQRLVAATSFNLGTPFISEGPHIQAIVTNELETLYISQALGNDEVSLIDPTSELSSLERQQLTKSINEIRDFFGRQLESVPALRIGIDLDITENPRSMPGALLRAPLTWYPISQRSQEGHPFPIARMIANNWWGTGCSTNGPHGVSLAGGIAFAMGLEWTRRHAPASYFNAILSGYRQRLVRKPFFARSTSKPGQRTVELGIVIYDGLTTSNSMWECLGPLTRRCWSLDTHERIVLETLASFGVKVTEFQRISFMGK